MKSLIFAFLAATCALAAQCPTNISPVTTTIIQSFNGATTSYEWTISPTSLVSQTPADSMACSSSGYISQYTPGGSCDVACNQQVGTPTVQGDACVYTFTDGGVRTMSLTLTCAEGVNTMNLANTVPVTQPSAGSYSYAFSGTYAGVCDAPPQPTTTAAACPTNIVGVTTTITQFYAGVATDYEWTISPTSMINSAPGDSDACTTAAYISQYTPNGHCDSTVTQKVGQPYRDGNACVYTFTDGLATVMTVSLQCNAASTTMDLANSVPLTLNGNTYNYAFTGSYAGVCTSPVPTYTSAVAPTQIIPSQCPTYVPAVTTTLSQIFNGLSTPYEWTISPSAPVNQPPSDVNACTSSAFISQYTPGGSCDAAANFQLMTPYINNAGACIYSFSDGGSRSMSLTLSCDQASNTMNLSPTVPVALDGVDYHFSFTGTYAGVCGSASSAAPTQLTTQPSPPVSTTTAIKCPTNGIPPVTTTISQIFQGASTPYEWTISPTDLVSIVPSDSTACDSPAYISMYWPGGNCEEQAAIQTSQPAVVGDTCVYSYSNGAALTFSLTLSCALGATTMALDTTVPVTAPTANSYHYAFTGTYGAVCRSWAEPIASEPADDVAMWKIIVVASAAVAVIGITVALSIMLFRRKPSAKADPLAVDFLQKA